MNRLNVWIPCLDTSDALRPAALARAIHADITLCGLVSSTDGAGPAKRMRAALRKLDPAAAHLVIASPHPWQALRDRIRRDGPDLLLIDAATATALKLNPTDALADPLCDTVYLRPATGKAKAIKRVLIALRGGPSAELALRLGMQFDDAAVTALNVRLHGASPEPAYRGLAEVLAQLPAIDTRTIETHDATHTILDEARSTSLLILGAGHTSNGVGLGATPDQALAHATCAVAIVRAKRTVSEPAAETAGAGAISILVDKWFAENTFHAGEFADLRALMRLKEKHGLTISLALPALNEEATVGAVIRTVKRTLMDRIPLLDEMVLIDSNSTDRTRDIADKLGVPVHIHQALLPELGARRGKGEALWKSLLVTRGDLIVWIDTDIVNIHPRFVYGVLGPLLADPQIQFVKGFYRRPLKVGAEMQAGGGGRVTELSARPMINLFYPELSGVIQPLSGEYGGRRTALERCVFTSGYGVETSLLIDIFEQHGLNAIAQTDLLERIHHNQPLEALSKMSFAIIQTVMRKLERRYDRAFMADVNKSMKLIRPDDEGYTLAVEEVAERERPRMIDVAAYRDVFKVP
jgi:glycosyltransferase involved in cell wall biosynthesis/nucleotide-binding universal stress UspA family protein